MNMRLSRELGIKLIGLRGLAGAVCGGLLALLVGCGGGSGRNGTDIVVSGISGPTASVQSGAQATFEFTVSNVGENPAVDLDIRNGPSGMSVDSITCTAERGAVCPNPTAAVMVAPSMPRGGLLRFKVTGTVVRGVNGQISNTISATYSDDIDRNNNSATVTGTGFTLVSDLVVTGTGPSTPATSGGIAEFQMAVRNEGPNEATAIKILNTVGPNLQLSSITCAASGGAICPATVSVATDVEKMPAGGVLTFTVNALVNPGINGTVVNTMEVTATDDEDRTDNRVTATATVVTPRTGVSVVGVGSLTPAVGGTDTVFTMTVGNSGPDPATNVTIVNTVGSGLTLSGITCTAANGAACPSAVGPVMTLSTMPVGGTLTFAVTARAAVGVNGTLVNTMQVSADNDTDRTDNSATASVTATTPRVGLYVSGVGPTATLTGGADAVFTMTVGNAGPDPALNATVFNNVGSGLTLSSITCAAGAGAVCPATVGPSMTLPTLAAGASLTFTVTTRLVSGANGTLTNTMQVAADNDTDRGDNTATVSVKAVTPRVGVYVNGVGPTGTVIGGTETDFVMTVGNLGPDPATNITIIDNPGSNLTLTKITCVAAKGATCPATLAPSMTVPSLPAEGTLTFNVTVRLSQSANGTITNTMQVTAENDTDRTDNAATAVAQAFTPRSDLSVTGTGTADVASGQSATFRMTVTNNGPDPAEKVRLINAVGGNLTLTGITCSAFGGATCPAVLGPTMDATGIPVNGGLVFDVTATVANATQGTITNTLSARVTSGIPSEAVGVGVGSAYTNNVSVTASGPSGPIASGSSVVFVMTVANSGPGSARNVTLTNTVSVGLTLTGIGCTASGGAVCPASPGASMTASEIPSGGSLSFSVSATIVSGTNANVSNNLKAVAPGDFFPGDNAATATFRATP